MVRLYAVLVGLSLAVIGGCAATSIQGLSDDELCMFYYLKLDDPRASLGRLADRDSIQSYDPKARKAAVEEIRRRELIRSEHWKLTQSGRVRKKMSRCAVLAAIGAPSKTNPSDDMWIYHRPGRSSLYVAFEEGRVVSSWAN